jgi:hypothetical protein
VHTIVSSDFNRVPDDYTSYGEKVIKLSDQQLEMFAGIYELKGGDGDADDIAEVSVAAGHLSIKHEHDDQPFPVSDVKFVTEGQSFDVGFSKTADGSVTKAVINSRNVWLKKK